MRLLNRTARRVSLTDKGRVFYNRCLQILGDIERAEDLTAFYQSPPLASMPIHTSFFVAPILVDYLSNFPDSRVDFRTEERAIGSDRGIMTTSMSRSAVVHRRAWTQLPAVFQLGDTVCAQHPRISTG